MSEPTPTGQNPYGSGPIPPAPGAPAPGAPPAYGPVTGPPLRPDEERTWSLVAHFGGLLFGFWAPLLVFLIFKDRSVWVREQAKEALNFNISYGAYMLAAAVLILVLIGIIVLPIVAIAFVVLSIIGGVKASNGEFYRYPATFRLVK